MPFTTAGGRVRKNTTIQSPAMIDSQDTLADIDSSDGAVSHCCRCAMTLSTQVHTQQELIVRLRPAHAVDEEFHGFGRVHVVADVLDFSLTETTFASLGL